MFKFIYNVYLKATWKRRTYQSIQFKYAKATYPLYVFFFNFAHKAWPYFLTFVSSFGLTVVLNLKMAIF